MSAVASKNGTKAIFGPMPIRSSRKMSIAQATLTDSNSVTSASCLVRRVVRVRQHEDNHDQQAYLLIRAG
jgi:hypothetical protein